MSKKHKRTCWILQAEWELYDERDSSIELFSSLEKAQKRMTDLLNEDVNNNLDRFDSFEYSDDENDGKVVYNKIPMEILKNLEDKPLRSKWVNIYDNWCPDYVTYTITKQEIK